MMKFINLQLENWQQFSIVNIDFHEKLTIITGANGSGKSTLLRILSQYLGWNIPLLKTPKKLEKEGYAINFFGKEKVFRDERR